ncbi:DUF2125 domain-containing protein [Puniceibacterium sp. IMCC21224]|uniref:DUF2125 domain-containing protein n=1 Tax=Puniceibacterium sp. IMCC21224 TaxID=1618204 RepID=UPI00064DBAC2|nr:DUF2125 domain-containing protein [Puniceibacterium sp. IMCC21224]KMK68875.1 hypothetical protein IMCC21224_113761 [Puniceibacterium sp. IMCC21224]
MKRLAIAIILAGLGWSLWWFWAAHALRGETIAWFDARRDAGWQATYDDLVVRGFPNRLDTTLSGLTLGDPQRDTLWQAPFFQILQLSYTPDHLIAVWPESQTLTLDGESYGISGDGLRASMVRDSDDILLRVNAEAQTLNISSASGAVAVAGLNAALHVIEDRQNTYRLSLVTDAVARSQSALAPLTGDNLDVLRANAIVTFDRPWISGSLPASRPQPTRIDLTLVEYRVGTLEVKLAGKVELDDQGAMTGKLTFKAVNWRDLLDLARDGGPISDSLASTLEQGLSLMAGLSGNAKTLDLPLTLKDGQMSLGLIPLGQAPRIRLP